MSSIIQSWVNELPHTQQNVLMYHCGMHASMNSAYSDAHFLFRWIRRCAMIADAKGGVLNVPIDENNSGNLPSVIDLQVLYDTMYSAAYKNALVQCAMPPAKEDEVRKIDAALKTDWGVFLASPVRNLIAMLNDYPLFLLLRIRDASLIISAKHPNILVRNWWHEFYILLCNSFDFVPCAINAIDQYFDPTPVQKEEAK